MLLDERSIGADWRTRFDASPQPADLDRFTQHLLSAHMPHAVIVDCSASPLVADRYADNRATGAFIVDVGAGCDQLNCLGPLAGEDLLARS